MVGNVGKRRKGRKSGERDRLPIPVFLGFPGGSAGKESTCNVGDLGLITMDYSLPGSSVHGILQARILLSRKDEA